MTAVPTVDLAVVLVNYRTPEMTVSCIESVLADLHGVHGRVVVVDNHSDDGSADKIAAWLAQRGPTPVDLIRSERNTGFAGGNNLGVRSVCARYYLLLNSDAQLRKGCLATLLSAARADPAVGLVGPRLEGADATPQQSCFRFHTPVAEFLAAARTGPLDRLLARYVVALPVQPAPLYVEWLSFACVLVRNEVFRGIGLLDDGYFMYFEDQEFCFRAARAGWKVLHTPHARVVHLRGGSSPVKRLSAERKRLPRYFYEARTRFFYQLYGRSGLTAANLLWWTGRCISKVRQIAGSAGHGGIADQWKDLWINWKSPLAPHTRPQ